MLDALLMHACMHASSTGGERRIATTAGTREHPRIAAGCRSRVWAHPGRCRRMVDRSNVRAQLLARANQGVPHRSLAHLPVHTRLVFRAAFVYAVRCQPSHAHASSTCHVHVNLYLYGSLCVKKRDDKQATYTHTYTWMHVHNEHNEHV
jgi:hypothetical protein